MSLKNFADRRLLPWPLCRRVLLHNLRYNEPVAAFANASGVGTMDEAFLGGQPRSNAGGGAVNAIAFRTGKRRLFEQSILLFDQHNELSFDAMP